VRAAHDDGGDAVKIGGTFSLDWMGDLGAVREVAQALDDAGFDSVAGAGHILTAADGRFPDRPAVTYALPYRDPFVLFAHLAGATTAIRFRTGILIMPLFPTALLARQAAELSAISGGRFDLGVGISWNEAEYAALGQDVHTRGARFEEQLEVLRRLWSQPLVTFHGRFHSFDELGLGRVPEHPIPILIGCSPEARLLRRVARLGDGWLPLADPSPSIEALHGYAAEAGRDPGALAIVARMPASGDPADAEQARANASRLTRAGATEITLTPPPGASPGDGITALLATKRAIEG
jgi:probable F420-dependent oxidoreductase